MQTFAENWVPTAILLVWFIRYMTISYIRDCVAIYGHCDNLTTGGPVLKYKKMLPSCNFICVTGALDTLQSSHISAKGGIWVFRPTTGTWFRCEAAIFPPKAAYWSLDLLYSIIQVYEQWLSAIRFSRAGKGRRMADKPGIDDPISDQSTASTSGKSQGSRNQKKKPEAIQAEKQAKSSKDSNVSDKLIFLSHQFRISKKITRNSIVGWRCSKPKWIRKGLRVQMTS